MGAFIPINPYPNANLVGSQGVAGPLGAGAVFSRTGSHFQSCPNGGQAVDSTLARIVFEAPDGSQTELVDQNTNGAVYTIPNFCSQTPGSVDAGRGTDFRSTDGGTLQFLSDSPILDYTSYGYGESDQKVTGTLRFANGMSYRIVNSVVQWMRDRHGNLIQFQYASGSQTPVTWYLSVDVPSQITDPLGRTITLNYNDSTCGGCTTITYPGYQGAPRVIQIGQTHLSNGLLRGYSLQTPDQLFGGTNQPTSPNFDPVLPRYIQYPDGRQFTFQYNPYGELARVNLPTGGAIEYDYGDGHNGWGSGFEGSASDNNPVMIYRRLQERREYASGGSTLTARTKYTVSSANSSTVETATTDDGNGNILARTVTTMNGSPLDALQLNGTSCNAGSEGLVTKIESGYPATLQTVTNTYASQAGCASPSTLTARTTTLNDTGAVSEVDFPSYDSYRNLLEQDEYDWGSGTKGPLLRTTKFSYATGDPNYTQNAHLLHLPQDTTVLDGTGHPVAYTLFRYDELDAHHQLHDAPGIVGHDSNYGTGFNPRGNLTTIWRSRTGTTNVDVLSAQMDYDIAGNLITQRDGNQATGTNGNQTSTLHSYNDSYSDGQNRNTYAYRTASTNALGQTNTFRYDFNSGLLVQAFDANQVQTTYSYNDPLDRLISLQQAVGTSAQTTRTYQYPSTTQTIEYAAQTSSTNLRTDTWLDGLGRGKETDTYEDGSHSIAVQTTYDALGRVSGTTNPYRPGDTVNWTTPQYDSLGRLTGVTKPDGSVSSTSYAGPVQTVTDEAGRQKRYSYDALGRLASVVEDPAGLNYTTSYGYDALGNLTAVQQGSQQRTFTYDGLGRLTSAANPESGTVTYNGYDAAGNLLSKTDARNVTTLYGYDVLNRLLSQTYSDGTPTVSYGYDPKVPNGLGRLGFVSNRYSWTNYTGYDALGRVMASTQTTANQTYSFAYGYNLTGALASETYPSGHTVTTSYDGANRVSQVQGSNNGGTNYLTQVQYAAHGAPSFQSYGNTVTRSTSFNSRLQPKSLWDALNNNGNQFLFIQNPICWGGDNDPNCDSSAKNNGNLYGALVYQGGPGPSSNLSITKQVFSYDGVNRLHTAQDNIGWARTFNYDPYGNMWVTNPTGPVAGNTPQGNGFTARNQINNEAYDQAGNQTSMNAEYLSYDAENRLISAVDMPGLGYATERYYYDGLGQRVAKDGPSGTTV